MVTIYSIGCPQCNVLEAKVKASGIDHEIIYDEKIITEKGYMYLPVMVVDGKEYDFSSAIKSASFNFDKWYDTVAPVRLNCSAISPADFFPPRNMLKISRRTGSEIAFSVSFMLIYNTSLRHLFDSIDLFLKYARENLSTFLFSPKICIIYILSQL